MRPQRWELGGGQRADDWDLAGQDKESDFTPGEVGSNCRVQTEECHDRIVF